jgi:DNA-binding GntR family transcriptional regulator
MNLDAARRNAGYGNGPDAFSRELEEWRRKGNLEASRRSVEAAAMKDDSPFPLAGEDASSDGLPLYMQVAATLRTAILRGIYPVGSRVPTEDELCRRFSVSRYTIREALRQLRVDNLITSRPGSRPIVAPPLSPARRELIANGIGEDFFDYTIATRLEIETMEMMPVTRVLADETGLPAGEQWLYASGYRTSIDDGHTTCWNEYFINVRYALMGRLLARHVGPLIPLLEDLFNQRITRITRAMSAVGIAPQQAHRLGAARGSPALRILTRCETADGGTAMLNRSIHPTGTISYRIDR